MERKKRKPKPRRQHPPPSTAVPSSPAPPASGLIKPSADEELPPIEVTPEEADVEDAPFRLKTQARRVTAAKHVIPHFYITRGVEVTALLHQAQGLSLKELVERTGPVVERARKGKLSVEERQHATFTISNLGMFDVEHFAPIVNPPSAITLAVASALPTPVGRATPHRGTFSFSWGLHGLGRDLRRLPSDRRPSASIRPEKQDVPYGMPRTRQAASGSMR